MHAILCSAHDWTSPIQVSAHHHTRALLRRGWRAGFLGAPVTPAHVVASRRRPDLRRRVALARQGPVDQDGCWARTPFTLAPVFSAGVRLRAVVDGWHRGCVPSLLHEIQRAGLDRPDLLVLDTPLYGFLVEALRPRRVVYRVTDFNPGFASATPALLAAERRAAARADLVVHTAESLRGYATELAGGRPVAPMPNGVDVSHFATPRPEPADLAGIPHPRLVYVGSLQEWFDYAGVQRLAADNPDLHVVVIGPGAEGRFAAPADNLHILGARPYDDVPGYLQHADVGLIPFDQATSPDLIAHTNPLKLYEYMAAGLPVVATRWPTLEALGSPAVLVGDTAEMAEAARKVVADPDALVERGQRYAADHGWDARLADVLAALDLR